MKAICVPVVFAALSLAAVSEASTVFVERFETPPVMDMMFLDIPGPVANFDNPGWEITTPGMGGVFLDNNFIFNSGSQLLGLGAANTSGASISILIGGFSDLLLPSISYDHYSMPFMNQVQTTTVTVTDPNNGDSVIYSRTVAGDGSIDESFTNDATGDTVRLTIYQSGDTNSSDSAIDNVIISALPQPIPEPSRLVLLACGIGAAFFRRRRDAG